MHMGVAVGTSLGGGVVAQGHLLRLPFMGAALCTMAVKKAMFIGTNKGSGMRASSGSGDS